MAFSSLLILYCGGGLAGVLGILFFFYTIYVAYIHWKYSHLPSPKMPSFYSGHLPDLWRLQKEIDKEISFSAAVDIWSERVESKTFIIFFFHAPILFTVDPAVVKEVTMNIKNGKSNRLVQLFSKVFGERFMEKGLLTIPNYDAWKSRRQLYDPAFKRNYLKTLTTTFNEITNATIEEMKTVADGKTVVPLKKYIIDLAVDVISKVTFGTDFSKIWTAESLGIEVPEDYQYSIFFYIIDTAFQAMQLSFGSIYPPLNQFLYPKRARKYRKCVQALRKIGRDCIMKRIKMIQDGGEIPHDILTFMLSFNHDNVSMEELIDDFVNFYFAGLHATAATLMFAFILISQHPNTLERLMQEVKDVLGERTTVSDSDLEELQYTEQVIYETLRLYPPAFGLSRDLSSPLTVGNYTFPAGLNILLNGANMYRKSEYFADPDVFNPDRFHSDNEKPSSFVYFPFGVGHRSCIGKHFALMEAKIALARVVQTFTIKFPEDYKINAITRMALQPKDDLMCTMTLK